MTAPVSRALTALLLCCWLAVDVVDGQWGGAFLNSNDGGGRKSFGPGSQGPGQQYQQPGGQFGDGNGAEPERNMNQEYRDKWMPTARPGFEVPMTIKKMMEAAKNVKPQGRAEFRSNTGFMNKMNNKDGSTDDEADDESEEAEELYFPKSSPGRKGDQSKRMDKCLRKVAHFCSMRVMQENFAMFNACVFSMSYRISDECRPWAEGHGPCVDDMISLCPKMSPADTTECLKKNKQRLSTKCVDSNFYRSMEEGFAEFRAGMKEGMRGRTTTAPMGPNAYRGPLETDGDEDVRQSPPKGPSGGVRGDDVNEPEIVRLRSKVELEDVYDL